MALKDSISTSWDSYNQNIKVMIVAGGVILVSVIVYTLFLTFSKSKATLFSDLEPRDASAIVKELEKMKVAYKMEDGGTKIVVDDNIVHKTRAKVIGSGVNINGGVGFEIFDKDEFGTTEFAQKINLQRAMQGELARTIMAFDAIKLARVHLVFPETSLFKRNKQDASASVTVFFKPGRKFTVSQIKGVKQLVASSVPGLSRKNVSVIDQSGIILASNDGDEFNIQNASLRLGKKKEIETYLMAKAQGILDQVFGYSKSMVTVDVSLDFNNVNKRVEHVDNESGKDAVILRKRESSTTKSGGAEDKSAVSNMEVDYMVGKSVENIISTPGAISRLTVAVVLPAGVTVEQKAEMESLISGTIGINPDRGDLITVISGVSTQDKEISTIPLEDKDFSSTQRVEVKQNAKDLFGSSSSIVTMLEEYMLERMRLLAGIFAGMVFVIIGLLMYVIRIKKNNKTVIIGDSLTNDQRQKLLNEIQSWIENDSGSDKKVAV